jgi:ABC-type antimicrobial peptide transport system permease subunit
LILGEDLWRRRYGGDPRIIGRTLDVGDSGEPGARATVIGVMPSYFHLPDLAQLWVPIRLDPAKTARTDYYLHGAGRLKPGVTVEQASTELQALLDQVHRENPNNNNGWSMKATAIRKYLAGSYREVLFTLLAAVGLLLLIACANVSNLLLVKASARIREMAVRTALGATRRRLLRLLITESLLLGLMGGAIGVGLTYLGIPALLSLVPIEFPPWMNFSVDYRVLGFARAVSLLTSVGLGIVPAFGASGGDLTNTLKEGGRGGSVSVRHLVEFRRH